MQNDIINALDVLRNGGVILYPTDTIWGLGCDATNPEAVARIYEIKQRTDNKSVIVLMDSANRIASYVDDVPDVAYDIIEMATKPLTVILEGAKMLAPNVINSNDNSIGIRIADDSFCRQLIQRFRKPIVSTSANITGHSAPSVFNEISPKIVEQADYTVAHRQNDLSKATPSGIIKIGKGNVIKIIRE